MGIPLNRPMRKVKATVQWMMRVPRRGIEHGVLEARALELRHARVAHGDHLLLGPELQAAGRTRFDARGLQSDFDAVDTQRALGHLARRLVELRDVERTAGRAITASNAFRRID